MTFTTGPDQVLKTDARGRVRVPLERREALLDEFERSGLSGVKFAALVDVKYPTFALWVQKRRQARSERGPTVARPAGTSTVQPVRFLEAVTIGAADRVEAGAEALRIELPGGARVFVQSASQARWAAELLRSVALTGSVRC